VAESPHHFLNVIICEDIRDEIGNKKSLMGIFAGDIIVAELPATIQMAVFAQYVPAPYDEEVSVEFQLLEDDTLMAKAKMATKIANMQPASFILPRALVTFDKETIFKILAAINGGEATEIIRKKICKGPIADR
jgi:hypothetical protein